MMDYIPSLVWVTIKVPKPSAEILSRTGAGVFVYIDDVDDRINFGSFGRLPTSEEAERLLAGLQLAGLASANNILDATRVIITADQQEEEDHDERAMDP